MGDFKNLNITVDKIEKIIAEFVSKANGKYEVEEKPNKIYHIKIIVPGQKEALLIIYDTKKGITINPKVGANQELSFKIAELIRKSSKKVETAHQEFSGIFQDLFEEFLTEFRDEGVEIKETQDLQHTKTYKLKNAAGHELAVNYYPKNHKVFIQGRTTKLYDDVVLWFADKIIENPQEIVEIIFNSMDDFNKYNIEFPDELITKHLIEKTDDAFKLLVEDEKKWLKTSFYLLYFIKDLPEYYAVVSGSLKVVEGILRRILINKYGLRGAFQEKTKAFKPLREYLPDYPEEKHKKVIEQLYNFIKDKRHKYAHSTGIKSNLIENRSEAEQILEDVIRLMKEVKMCKKGLL